MSITAWAMRRSVGVRRSLTEAINLARRVLEVRPDSGWAKREVALTLYFRADAHLKRLDPEAALDTKIREELGWRPDHDFASGMEATVRWYLDNADWCAAVQGDSYSRERLGLGQGAGRA